MSTDWNWGYEYDRDYAECEGEPAILVVVYDENTGQIIDTLGGVIPDDGVEISDHGDVILSWGGLAYCQDIAEQMMTERAK